MIYCMRLTEKLFYLDNDTFNFKQYDKSSF